MSYKDKEKDKAYRKEYYQRPEYKAWRAKWAKEWREKNPERNKANYTSSFARNYEKSKPRRNAYLRNLTKRKRLAAIEKYGGKCICCGEGIPEFLNFDHVDNDGKSDRAKFKGARTWYNWLLNNPVDKRIQILCWNCNMSKGRYGICPHLKESLSQG